jgi:hypothetical protein
LAFARVFRTPRVDGNAATRRASDAGIGRHAHAAAWALCQRSRCSTDGFFGMRCVACQAALIGMGIASLSE